MEQEKIKSFPVYLPESKFDKLNDLSKKKRTPKTKIIEAQIDKLLEEEELTK